MRFSECKTVCEVDAELQRRLKRTTWRRWQREIIEAATRRIDVLSGNPSIRRNPDDAMEHIDPSYDFDRDEHELNRAKPLVAGPPSPDLPYDCFDDATPGYSVPDFQRTRDGRLIERGMADRQPLDPLPAYSHMRRLVALVPGMWIERYQGTTEWRANWRLPCRLAAKRPVRLNPLPHTLECQPALASLRPARRNELDFAAEAAAETAAARHKAEMAVSDLLEFMRQPQTIDAILAGAEALKRVWRIASAC